jgi:hypothetical protein
MGRGVVRSGFVLLLLAAPTFLFTGCNDLALVGVIREIKNPPVSYTRFVSTLGPPGATTRSLLVSGSTIFAGCEGGGVYKSTNYGGSWTVVGDFLPSDVRALATDGTYLYAGVGTSGTDPSFGVHRVTLAGNSWEHLGLSYVVTALATDGIYLYAGTRDYGVRRLPLSGGSWALHGSALSGKDINCLEYDGTYLWTGVSGTGSGAYRYESTDWVAKNLGALIGGQQVIDLFIHGGTLFAVGDFAGIIYWSGSTWAAHGTGITATRNYTLAGYGSYLFAAINNDGVYRCSSTNHSEAWVKFGSGSDEMVSAVVYSLAVASTTIVAGTGTGPGLYKRSVTGTSSTAWDRAGSGIFSSTVFDLVTDGTTLFAGTEKGVYARPLSGGFWSQFGSGGSQSTIYALVIEGSDLYAAGTYSIGPPAVTQVNKIPLSGGSWSAFNNGLGANHVRSLHSDGSYLYAGTWTGYVYQTAIAAASWTTFGTPNPPSNGAYGIVEHSGTLFLSTNQGICYIPLSGGTWQLLGTYNGTTYCVVSDGTYLYIGTPIAEVKRIPLSGLGDWEDFGSGFPAGSKILALQLMGDELIAGLEDKKVYSIPLSGGSWQPLGTGLFDGATVDAFMLHGDTLYLGTGAFGIGGSGVWQSEVIIE